MRDLRFQSGSLRKNATWITVRDETGREIGSIGTEAIQAHSDGKLRIITTWHPKNLLLNRYVTGEERKLCNKIVEPPTVEEPEST